MRLLDVHSYSLLTPEDSFGKRYVIVSHRWLPGGTEIIFPDMPSLTATHRTSGALQAPPGKEESLDKLRGACETVRADRQLAARGVHHIWLDTVCIDKSSSAELSESINSMYAWYRDAERCLTYMPDYRPGSGSPAPFTGSVWFERGWTLQELVAPGRVDFYDADWRRFGDRASLSGELEQRTGVQRALLQPQGTTETLMRQASVAHRMSWAARRKVFKEEDIAYCLMGIFGVNMPVLYGEGMEGAFRRLQEEIIKFSDDHSIFAWTTDAEHASDDGCGLLAPSPKCFAETGTFAPGEGSGPYVLTNKGLEISLRMFEIERDVFIASLDLYADRDHCVGIYLRRGSQRSGNQYRRIRANKLCKVQKDRRGEMKTIYVRQR